MVGKLSDDTKMSGSRIPILWMWSKGISHPYSTPNDELRRSIQARDGELERSDIGEPGVVGNLLEPTLLLNCCDELGLPDPKLTPPVFKQPHFEVSCDGLVRIDPDDPVTIRPGGIVSIECLDDPQNPPSEVILSGLVPIECKCTGDYPGERIPFYRGPIQLQAQMMVTGATAGIIITLHRGIERRITLYRASEKVQREIDEICLDFQRRVATDDWYPPVSVSDAAIPPAGDDPEPVDITGLAEDIERLELLRNARGDIDAEIEDIELAIMSAMGDAKIATAGRYRVEWPTRKYKAQPERTVEAKPERVVRLKSLKIRDNI